MSGFGILDVAIGLALVYLLLALIVSVVNEWIAAVGKRRANGLVEGLRTLLDSGPNPVDENVNSTKFFAHPLICSLYQGTRKPSYLTSETFALALMDLIHPAREAGTADLASLRASILNLSPSLQRKLLPLVDVAGDDFNRAMLNLEAWFNAAMERLSGTYKRWNMLFLAGIALVLTVALDADTFAICRTLWTNPVARQVALDAATAQVRNRSKALSPATRPTTSPSETELRDEMNNYIEQLNNAELVHGIWSTGRGRTTSTLAAMIQKLFGWLITIAAVSLGAPFWFDTLNRFVNFRSAVKPGHADKA